MIHLAERIMNESFEKIRRKVPKRLLPTNPGYGFNPITNAQHELLDQLYGADMKRLINDIKHRYS